MSDEHVTDKACLEHCGSYCWHVAKKKNDRIAALEALEHRHRYSICDTCGGLTVGFPGRQITKDGEAICIKCETPTRLVCIEVLWAKQKARIAALEAERDASGQTLIDAGVRIAELEVEVKRLHDENDRWCKLAEKARQS